MSLFLVVVVLMNMGYKEIYLTKNLEVPNIRLTNDEEKIKISKPINKDVPDVYYILLDGYASLEPRLIVIK